MSSLPQPPTPQPPKENWPHYRVWSRIHEVLHDIPRHFKSTITVSGIRATEVFTFGPVLGVTIEEEVVRTLNDLRDHWDAGGEYASSVFVRQSETFPDVLFRNQSTGETVIGIELKSWYLLAKEGEPSFRFTVSHAACATPDLLVVVPWTLSNVLSGSPIIFKPYVELACYVAEYRNYWWQTLRTARANTQIITPPGVTPYPAGRDEIADLPVNDKGKNFGRIARIRIMDKYVNEFRDLSLLGITVSHWREFFRTGIKEEIQVGLPPDE